jgi:methionyl-tRNA formyltransferase
LRSQGLQAGVRIAFLGNDRWSIPPLEALVGAHDIDVALVLTNPPRPAGRGSDPRSTAVATAARRLATPLLEAEGVRRGTGDTALRDLEPDAIVVVAYGELLGPATLQLPPLGCVNVHFSLLPRWRGASPVQHAILAGDAVTGVSVMRMDEGLDTGPLIASVPEPIAPEDDAASLGLRLARLGGPLLVQAVRALAEGTASPQAQEEREATYAPKLGPGDRAIDWGAPAEEIARLVRAMSPVPGATTTFRGRELKILRVRPRDERLPAGRILPGVDGPLVGTGTGVVELLDVAPSGRRRMPGDAWMRGAHLRPDEILA